MSVFQDLRDAFRQAVENFKEELDRDRIPETVDELLRGMREEIIDAQAHLRGLEEDIRKALERARAEEREAATCRRRERMADEIDDEETARVARKFAEKHEERKRVLEQKALALKDELDLRRAEVREMLDRLEEARRRRESLSAGAGRVQARDSIREADDLFAELDRMADRIGDFERRERASREMAQELDDLETEQESVQDLDAAAEDRLQDLKRRLREDG